MISITTKPFNDKTSKNVFQFNSLNGSYSQTPALFTMRPQFQICSNYQRETASAATYHHHRNDTSPVIEWKGPIKVHHPPRQGKSGFPLPMTLQYQDRRLSPHTYPSAPQSNSPEPSLGPITMQKQKPTFLLVQEKKQRKRFPETVIS